MTRLRRRLAAGREAGFTLIELVVTMFILMILLGIISDTVIRAQKASSTTAAHERTLADLRIAFDTMTRSIRAADAAVGSGPGFLQQYDSKGKPISVSGQTVRQTGLECWFTTNLGKSGTPRLAHYYVTGSGQLIEEFTAPDAGSGPNYTYSGAPYSRRILASGVVVPTGTGIPVFTYNDQSGNPLNGPSGSATQQVTAQVPDSSMSGVGSVLLTVTESAPANGGAESTTLQDQVRIVNADLGGS